MNLWAKIGLGCFGAAVLSVIALVIFVVLLVPRIDQRSSSTRETAVERPDVAPSPPSPPVSPRPDWTTVGEWSGSGAKNTELFRVSANQWRIRWTAEDTSGFGAGLMQVFVYREGQEFPAEIPVNTQVKDKMSDLTYIQGSGTFRIQCNCANVRWKMIAEQQTR